MGTSLDLIYARTGWDGGGIEQQINQVGGWLGYRARRASPSAPRRFHRTRWTPLDVAGPRAGSRSPQFTASAEVVLPATLRRTGRASTSSLAAGLQPVRGLALTGTARLGDLVAAPVDPRGHRAGAPRFRARRSAGSAPGSAFELGLARTAAFSPFALRRVSPRRRRIAPLPETEWLTAKARLAPLRWITLEGWYSDPRTARRTAFRRPTRYGAVTIRSKFLRQFPSGIFDLKLRVERGDLGRRRHRPGRDRRADPPRAARPSSGACVQIQLQRFTIYWDRGNLTTTELTYVPGFTIPSYGTTSGCGGSS